MKKFLVVMLSVVAITGLLVVPSFGAGEKLIVKDGSSNNSFVVFDPATVAAGVGMTQILGSTNTERVEIRSAGAVNSQAPTLQGKGFGGTITGPTATQLNHILFNLGGSGHDGTNIVVGNKATILLRAGENWTPTAQGTYMTFETTPNLSTGRSEKMRITGDGKVGVGTTAPTRLFSVGGSGAGSDGTTWFTSSSREYKDNVQELSAEKALETVKNMTPVTFVYKEIPSYSHVGFIAEDVPNLVATPDRKSLSAMDIVAVLTKVVQEQTKTIEALSAKVDMLEKSVTK